MTRSPGCESSYLGLLIVIFLIHSVNGLLHLTEDQIAMAVVSLEAVSLMPNILCNDLNSRAAFPLALCHHEA